MGLLRNIPGNNIEELLDLDKEALIQRVIELQAHTREIKAQLEIDPLTGALNKYGLNRFVEDLEQQVIERNLTGRGVIIAIDLDRFKIINDTYGHSAGDEVLKKVVKRLKNIKLEPAQLTVARPGGDEFVIVALDRRQKDRDSKDQIDLTEISFENFMRKTFRKAVQEVAQNSVKIKDTFNQEYEVKFGISEGYGSFETPTVNEIQTAFDQADNESYFRKSGLEEFLEIQEKDPIVKQFAVEILGFEQDPTQRGGYKIDRELGLSAISMHPEFDEFISAINRYSVDSRAIKWIFPQYFPQRTQISPDLGR